MPEEVITEVVRNTCILIEAAKEFNFPVLVTEQYPKGLGPTITEVTEKIGDLSIIEKISFSGYGASAFINQLKSTDSKCIFLCGMECHVCVLQSTLDLIDDNRHVFIPADAVCSRTKHNWQVGLDIMRQAGAVIGSTETFIFQMLGKAGTESFKKLARLLK